MRINVPCLTFDGVSPSFRMLVPADLRPAIGGCELKFSLRDLPLPDAAKLCIVLRRAIRASFQTIRRCGVDGRQMRPSVRAYYRRLFDTLRAECLSSFAPDGELGGEADCRFAARRRYFDDAAEELAEAVRGRDFSIFQEDAAKISEECGLGIREGMPELPILKLECARAKLEMLEAVSSLYIGAIRR